MTVSRPPKAMPVAPPSVAASEGELKSARAPQQTRGQRRVEEILDAAEAVIAEVGVEATTTHAIAERAGASVGSIYHFFPSKDAIIRAVVERFSALMSEINAQAIPPEAAHLPVEEIFARIVGNQARLIEERPAINKVITGECRAVIGEEAWCRIQDEIVGQVKRFLKVRVPAMPDDELHICALMSVMVVDRVLDEARLGPPENRAALLQQLQVMMVRYFTPLDAKYGAGGR
jgi:AcrR family transcriptional regulator